MASVSALRTTILCASLLCAVGAQRELLQIGGCAPADPTSGDVPEGALLYLSVRAEGEITYQCDANGVPTTVIGESAEISFSEENYEGLIALNQAGVLEASVTSEDGAENTITMGSDVAFSSDTPPLVLPKARWTVEDTVGTPPGSGGLPKLSYMVREDAIGGVPTQGECPPAGETTVPFEATYNFYTCEVAYLGPEAAPFPATAPPVSPPTLPPATLPPATVPPTTVPPTTVPPTTVPPETVPPTTVPPETVPPTTEPGTTAPPATDGTGDVNGQGEETGGSVTASAAFAALSVFFAAMAM